MKIEMRSKKDVEKWRDLSTYDRAVYMLSEGVRPRDIGTEELALALTRALVQASMYDGEMSGELRNRVMRELHYQRWDSGGESRYDWDYFCDPNFMYREKVDGEYQSIRTSSPHISQAEGGVRDTILLWLTDNHFDGRDALYGEQGYITNLGGVV